MKLGCVLLINWDDGLLLSLCLIATALQGLQVIERASCGTRGVIATRDISEEEAAAMPLAAIPQFMEVTDSISKDALLPIMPER